jgi:cytochrome c553
MSMTARPTSIALRLPLLLLKAVPLCASLGASLSVLAHDEAAASKKADQVCASCHGPQGDKPMVPGLAAPRLAGQNYEYLRQALTAYHDGSRQDATMSAMAQPLTPREIDDLAWYYSRQQGLTTRY